MLTEAQHDWNDLAATVHARGKDNPGKIWWSAEAMHPAVFRALHISPEDPGAVYALHPFRIARIEGKAVVLAAYPAPRIFAPTDPDWLDIETVLIWHPAADTVTVLGDTEPQIVGRFAETKEGTVYALPYAFFRAWAEARASYAVTRQQAALRQWSATPVEYDLVPGVLMVGKPDAIRWPVHSMPRDLAVVGADAAKINSAILKSARIPRAFQRAAA